MSRYQQIDAQRSTLEPTVEVGGHTSVSPLEQRAFLARSATRAWQIAAGAVGELATRLGLPPCGAMATRGHVARLYGHCAALVETRRGSAWLPGLPAEVLEEHRIVGRRIAEAQLADEAFWSACAPPGRYHADPSTLDGGGDSPFPPACRQQPAPPAADGVSVVVLGDGGLQ